jgi:hypothetical protein
MNKSAAILPKSGSVVNLGDGLFNPVSLPYDDMATICNSTRYREGIVRSGSIYYHAPVEGLMQSARPLPDGNAVIFWFFGG